VIRVLDQLRDAGVRIGVDDELVRGECSRIGRQLLDRGHRIVGLLPAGARVSVPPIVIQLAAAVHALGGQPIAIVDAAASWPVRVVHGDADFTACRVVDGITLFLPRDASPGGLALRLGGFLRDQSRGFALTLVDLTDLARLGEHIAAMALCDGVASVARSGVTREAELLRTVADIAGDRHLGVLLVGVP
jgi:hypothetical protein